ncbi:MAG: hypothetical protein JW709_13060 [Sedimentisphaerales bacterium]|nr:hypothetical protein [Sedimentisphaerales bacterium]
MKDRIEKYIAKSAVIKIYTDIEGEEEEYYGVPVLVSRSLLAFQEIRDFHFDGYRIVRLKDIVKIRRSKCDVVQEKILKHTGEFAKYSIPGWLRVGSWKILLKSIKGRNLCICIASGLMDVNVFVVGEIYALKDDAVVLKSFDAHGNWCKPKHRINYSDITEVSFGDEYSVTFNEFVKNGK